MKVLTAKDVPGVNEIGFFVQDQPIICDTKVRYIGDEEGLCAGISSGANVYTALEEAKKYKNKKTIVTILPDSMDRYITEERFVT